MVTRFIEVQVFDVPPSSVRDLVREDYNTDLHDVMLS